MYYVYVYFDIYMQIPIIMLALQHDQWWATDISRSTEKARMKGYTKCSTGLPGMWLSWTLGRIWELSSADLDRECEGGGFEVRLHLLSHELRCEPHVTHFSSCQVLEPGNHTAWHDQHVCTGVKEELSLGLDRETGTEQTLPAQRISVDCHDFNTSVFQKRTRGHGGLERIWPANKKGMESSSAQHSFWFLILWGCAPPRRRYTRLLTHRFIRKLPITECTSSLILSSPASCNSRDSVFLKHRNANWNELL